MNMCANCGIETTNPRFCSKSCSAKLTNRESPKRTLTRQCTKEDCNTIVANKRTSLCAIHLKEYKDSKTEYQLMTLEEYQNKPSVKGKHPSWINSHVRLFNRSWNKDLTNKPCEECGYSKHVELCHIRAVSNFPLTATLGEINHPDNMRVLCPNCHWEYDNL